MNNSRFLYSFYCKKKKINNIHINTKPTLCLLLTGHYPLICIIVYLHERFSRFIDLNNICFIFEA